MRTARHFAPPAESRCSVGTSLRASIRRRCAASKRGRRTPCLSLQIRWNEVSTACARFPDRKQPVAVGRGGQGMDPVEGLRPSPPRPPRLRPSDAGRRARAPFPAPVSGGSRPASKQRPHVATPLQRARPADFRTKTRRGTPPGFRADRAAPPGRRKGWKRSRTPASRLPPRSVGGKRPMIPGSPLVGRPPLALRLPPLGARHAHFSRGSGFAEPGDRVVARYGYPAATCESWKLRYSHDGR